MIRVPIILLLIGSSINNYVVNVKGFVVLTTSLTKTLVPVRCNTVSEQRTCRRTEAERTKASVEIIEEALDTTNLNRRFIIQRAMMTVFATSTTTISFGLSQPVDAAPIQDSLDIDTFLRTGMDTGGNMGVSSQAGKSRPVTGVIFRDGTDVIQTSQGFVTAEILTGTKTNPQPYILRFDCPYYKLETGSVFDIECRDAKTGDTVFVAVSDRIPDADKSNIGSIPTSILLDRLFSPTGRFSFYGSPTDIKIKKDNTVNNKRYMEVNFSTLSQATQSEIPRKAMVVATIPSGSDNAVVLVGSSTAGRWKSVQETMQRTLDSLEIIPSPKSNLKIRSKDRANTRDLF